MTEVLEYVNRLVWGIPVLALIVGAGLWLSLRTGFAQITLFPAALRSFWRTMFGKRKQGGVSAFQALCTALAATVGTGNIAGVAGAIAIGGPGAVFWMWVSALLAMVTKFAEASLAVHFRTRGSDGGYMGGPMYMILRGMGSKWKWLASVYCFFGVIAAFGVGNATQINAVIGGVNSAMAAFGFGGSRAVDLILGAVLAVLICAMLLGGARRIGNVAELLVPFAALAYLALGTVVLVCNARALPEAFRLIFTGAFSPQAVTGGVVGSAFTSVRLGFSRGVFTNEAGMGTASIAHAGADVKHPCDQGLMGIMEVFIDTVVICTMTALVILCSGTPVLYGTDEGAVLTTRAFAEVCGSWVSVPIALFLCCFAFATMLGWGLYGVRCAQFLFGDKVLRPFVLLQGVVVFLSTMLGTGTVWLLAEIVNGLMAIPNLIALFALSPVLKDLTNTYRNRKGGAAAAGGTYESFHQRKPLRTVSHEKIPPSGS